MSRNVRLLLDVPEFGDELLPELPRATTEFGLLAGTERRVPSDRVERLDEHLEIVRREFELHWRNPPPSPIQFRAMFSITLSVVIR